MHVWFTSVGPVSWSASHSTGMRHLQMTGIEWSIPYNLFVHKELHRVHLKSESWQKALQQLSLLFWSPSVWDKNTKAKKTFCQGQYPNHSLWINRGVTFLQNNYFILKRLFNLFSSSYNQRMKCSKIFILKTNKIISSFFFFPAICQLLSEDSRLDDEGQNHSEKKKKHWACGNYLEYLKRT